MKDYLPKFIPGRAVTFAVSDDVEGGQAVELTGDREVGPAGAGSTSYIGVAGFSAAAGKNVTVYLPGGIQRLEAAGRIDAGDVVETASNGRVTAGDSAPIGIAITGGASGDLVEVADSLPVFPAAPAGGGSGN